MDRCRCEDYREAVNKLKIWTPGTYRTDIIESNKERPNYVISWIKHKIDHCDRRFSIPKVWRKPAGEEHVDEGMRRWEERWCPYMTPFVLPMYDVEEEGEIEKK